MVGFLGQSRQGRDDLDSESSAFSRFSLAVTGQASDWINLSLPHLPPRGRGPGDTMFQKDRLFMAQGYVQSLRPLAPLLYEAHRRNIASI
jgi:hypothetical protein